jgi:hypothetical protein
MPTFDTLTQSQQDSVSAHLLQVRAIAGELARLLNKADALNMAWINTIYGLVTPLDTASIVLDSTGFAGAQPLTREDVLAHGDNIGKLLANHNTGALRALYVKTVGPTNTTG